MNPTRIALGLLMVVVLAGQARAADPCKLSTLEIPVTLVGPRAVAKVRINGTEVSLMVDSGAFFSFLTHAAAQQLQLKVGSLPWGMRIEGLTGGVEAGLTTVKSLQLQQGEIPNVDFVVGGNEDNSGTLGIMGRNLLAFTDTEYDLAHGMIRLFFPKGDCSETSMAYWAQDKPVSTVSLLRDENKSKTPAIQAIAQLNDKKLRVLFDTGAWQSLVSLSAARRSGIVDMTPSGKSYGAGRGEADTWSAAVGSFQLGGETIQNVRMSVADIELRETDMLLGIDFFLSHRIYVSKSQRRMYFTYNGGTVFSLSTAAAAKARSSAAAAPASAADAASAPQDEAGDADQPKDAAGFARRGAASAARLDFSHALADLDRACEMDPQVAGFFVRRGAVHEAMHQGRLALKDYETALQLDPAQAEARLRRAWWRSANRDRAGTLEDMQALDTTLAPQAHQRLEMARIYEKLNLPERALAQWSMWIPAHPEDIQLAGVLNASCWTRALLGVDLDKALDDCDQAIDLESKRGEFYDSRGWVRLRRGDLRRAVDNFDRALKLKPDSAWSLYGRGIARRKLGDTAAGQADIDAARKQRPTIDVETGRHGLAADPLPPADAASTPTSG